MFNYLNCKDYVNAATDYYNKLQSQFSKDIVNKIITGKALTEDIAKKQASIAADSMNKYCKFIKPVNSTYPFCCLMNFGSDTKSNSCIACNVFNNSICDLFGEDTCLNTPFCKLDNGNCVYYDDSSYSTINTTGCDETNRECVTLPPKPQPGPYIWDYQQDQCYLDSKSKSICDSLGKDKCVLVPRYSSSDPKTVVTYCTTRNNSLINVAIESNPIDPKCLPYRI